MIHFPLWAQVQFCKLGEPLSPRIWGWTQVHPLQISTLRMPSSSHGQLYVGCSRTTTRQGLKLLLPNIQRTIELEKSLKLAVCQAPFNVEQCQIHTPFNMDAYFFFSFFYILTSTNIIWCGYNIITANCRSHEEIAFPQFFPHVNIKLPTPLVQELL